MKKNLVIVSAVILLSFGLFVGNQQTADERGPGPMSVTTIA